MTTLYIANRIQSFSNKLEVIRMQMSNLDYQLQRQAPYDLKDHAQKIEEFSSAYIDIKEAIDKLDYLAGYFNEL
jgi:hypothetical protein